MKHQIVFFLVVLLFTSPALATGSSANYKITTEVLDSGGATGTSVSYSLMGKTRERELGVPSSSSFKIGEGFLRSAYSRPVALAPVVLSINPPSVLNNATASVSISGANYVAGATVKISLTGQPDIIATNVTVVNSGKITCDLPITGAAVGLWTITVTNPDGRFGTLTAFTIGYPAPVITAISPNKGENTDSVNITALSGNYFRAGAKVKLVKSGEADIIAEDVLVSSTLITCRFDLKGKTTGLWDVVVTNDDDQSGTLLQGFSIEAPFIEATVPVIAKLNPYNPDKGSETFTYSLSKDADIVLYVFNLRGEKIWQYSASAGSPGGRVGPNEVLWDGITAFRAFVSNGVYLVRLTTKVDGQIKTLSTTKVAVIK